MEKPSKPLDTFKSHFMRILPVATNITLPVMPLPGCINVHNKNPSSSAKGWPKPTQISILLLHPTIKVQLIYGPTTCPNAIHLDPVTQLRSRDTHHHKTCSQNGLKKKTLARCYDFWAEELMAHTGRASSLLYWGQNGPRSVTPWNHDDDDDDDKPFSTYCHVRNM